MNTDNYVSLPSVSPSGSRGLGTIVNGASASNAVVISTPRTHLLDIIRGIRASVGDGLNDAELTRLLRELLLPAEEGFAFLCLSDGFVTLTVPRQDLASWHSQNGWIMPEKARIMKAIAKKYELSLYEPPDETQSCRFPCSKPEIISHHLELGNRKETVVIAHPYYLKLRLFGAIPCILYAWIGPRPLLLGRELLHDLSDLYQE